MATEKFDAGEGATLEQAKAWLQDKYMAGAECPCCEQYVKLYKRKLNSSMAFVLIKMYWHARTGGWSENKWLHVPSFIAEVTKEQPLLAAAVRGDWAKLKHWDLIREKDGKRDDDSKRTGFYQITALGASFVLGQVRVPSHVYLFNEMKIDLPVGDTVTIEDVLEEKFDYRELMDAR